nr:GldG family protein [Gammaproteobacteria bacterium]
MIAAIAGRELRGLFVSAVGWTWLAVAVALVAWMLFAQLESFTRIAPRLSLADGAPGLTDLVAMPAIEAAGLLGILLAPLLGIRLFSEELRSGRIVLWLSAPVPPSQVVLGKFLGGLGLLALLWLATAILIASLQLGTSLDLGKLAAGLLGLLLLFAAALAITSAVSLLGAQPAAAASAAYGLLLLLWMVGGDGKGGTRWIGFGSRFQRFLDGVVYAEDVIFFLVATALLLGIAVLRLALLRSAPADGPRSRWPVWLLVVLLVATSGLTLRVAHRYGGAWDLTAGARQSLTVQSRAVVARLAGPVRITAIVPDAGGLRVPVQQLLDRYRRAKPDVSVQFLDPDLHPEQARQLGVRLPAELLIEHGGRSERVARISEQAITASLQRLSLEGERWIVGLSGHGEADLSGKANFDLGELGRVLGQAGYRLHGLGP